MRRTPLKRYTRIRVRSAKRERETQQRRDLVQRVLDRDKRQCRAARAVPEISCRGPLDVHEIVPRSAWSAGYLVESNCIIVCRAHHDWIGEHPAEAHGYGLHGFSWEREQS